MFAIILSVILSILSLGATQAPTQAPVQAVTAPVQAPITAPVQPLAYAAPTVATEAATKAPTQAPVAAPVCYEDMPCWDCKTMGNLICGNPVAAPVEAPICHEDMPCWDCSTMGNLICGNPTCADAGMITAEDYSCVPASFYSVTAAPTASDAWASYDAAGQAPTAATETIVEHVATTTDPSVTLDSTQTLVPSISEPQTFHIFSTTADLR